MRAKPALKLRLPIGIEVGLMRIEAKSDLTDNAYLVGASVGWN
jgi:hypothetical protein